ncbi:hypothetical protein [Mycobacteroides abscessus]|uniref:hypothetical protein n=1 Tax=Mycobacteroides abscessus TaxID=36809 RepID=UPI0019D28916|nr:hypothetical protein [Mycobacteroides abscessus]MBN7483725.1 hypothetical protein [Mycobacteroides abscessus subsp. massiliense]
MSESPTARASLMSLADLPDEPRALGGPDAEHASAEDEAPLTAEERLLLASVYLRLTSKDVLPPRQHPQGEENKQVAQSHILVSVSQSHNQSHGGAS